MLQYQLCLAMALKRKVLTEGQHHSVFFIFAELKHVRINHYQYYFTISGYHVLYLLCPALINSDNFRETISLQRI